MPDHHAKSNRLTPSPSPALLCQEPGANLVDLPIEFRNLIGLVLSYNPQAPTGLLVTACRVAIRSHQHQKRSSGDPYITHPLSVAEILANLKLDPACIITALLHDIVEDTNVSLDFIEDMFGSEIAFLVKGVTSLSDLENISSEAQQGEKFRRLLLAMAQDIRVLLVKLADRLHNMQTLHHLKSLEKRQRIALETIEIYVPLAERMGLNNLQSCLEDLCFEVLYPQDYAALLDKLNQLHSIQDNFIQPILEELRNLLENKCHVISCHGRAKSLYAIWNKIKKKRLVFEQLSDIMAFRFIVPSIEDCYQVLGIFHATYKIIPGRFKDYISVPKQNGYQSLQTTLIGPLQKRIEIQIRTESMHIIAEFGVAAHWEYKNSTQSISHPLIQNFLDILADSRSLEEFMDQTKRAMLQNQIFCFTPKGDLVRLPHGATALDFAYAVHSKLGNSCIAAKADGRLIPIRTPLKTGLQIEIIGSKAQSPSLVWEKHVITGKARAAIRRFVRHKERTNFIGIGQAIVAKAIIHHTTLISFLKIMLPFDLFTTLDDIYSSLGEGTLKFNDLIKRYQLFNPLIKSSHTPVFHMCNRCKPKNCQIIVGIFKEGSIDVHRPTCLIVKVVDWKKIPLIWMHGSVELKKTQLPEKVKN